MADLRVGSVYLETLDTGAPNLRVGSTFLEVLEATELAPPGTGGSPGSGTNPTDGTIPTTLPLVFVYCKLTDGTVLAWSETWGRLNDPSTYFGGEKQPRIRSLSSIRTEFSSDGAPKSYTWTVELDDADAALRTAARTQALKGAYLACYVVDDAVRRAAGTPYRFAAGYVISHSAREPMRMSLQCEGALGRKLSRINQQPKIPSHVLTATEFPGLDSRREGKSVHVAIGSLSDQSSSAPEGVVPWQFCGTTLLTDIVGAGGVAVEVDVYLLTEGALGWIYDSYFTIPEWGQEEVAVAGDLIRPKDETAFYYQCTVGGTTGTSEPTWPTTAGGTVVDGSVTWQRVAALNTLRRYPVPLGAYGTVLVTPYKPGWAAATGLATNYVDLGTPTRRYTLAFMLSSHRYARALREGRIQMAANVVGLTDAADGSGSVFTDPVEIAQWVLINEGFNTCLYTSYNSIPTFDAPEGTYSILDTASVAAAKAVGDGWLAGGVVGGMLLGRDGKQQKLFDFLRDITIGGFFRLGENRHGQITFHRYNDSATPTVTYEASEIIDGSVETWTDEEQYANHIRMFSAYRYEKQEKAATTDATDWANAVINAEDTGAQASVDETVTDEVQNYVVRDSTVAQELADRLLALRRGPAATQDGCPMMRFATRWQGLGKGSASVDLGTCIQVTHPEARRTTAQTMIVEGREVNALKGVVTLTCRVIEL